MADEPVSVALDPAAGDGPVRTLLGEGGRRRDDSRYEFDLDGYGYRWVRAGRTDGGDG